MRQEPLQPDELEALDALEGCRTPADLATPELRSLAEKLRNDPRWQRCAEQIAEWDERIAEALDDVAVPSDLEARLRATLAAAREAGLATAPPSGADAEWLVEPAKQPSAQWARRRWSQWTAAAVAALAAAGAFWLWPREQAPVGLESIAVAARLVHVLPDVPVELKRGPAPRDFAISHYVLLGAPPRWRWLGEGFFGRDALAYELSDQPGLRATLVVAQLKGSIRSPQLTPLPAAPLQYTLTTGGLSSTAWTDGELLFVLVVDGNEGALRRFVRSPGRLA